MDLFRSVYVVTHELIKWNKTFMASILKAFSTVMNENRRNKVFYRDKTTKNVKVQHRHFLLIKLLCSCDLLFNGSSESDVLHSERC